MSKAETLFNKALKGGYEGLVERFYELCHAEAERAVEKQLQNAEADSREYGRRKERERIIKLLEVLWQKTQGTDIPAVIVLPDAIALIKGEK